MCAGKPDRVAAEDAGGRGASPISAMSLIGRRTIEFKSRNSKRRDRPWHLRMIPIRGRATRSNKARLLYAPSASRKCEPRPPIYRLSAPIIRPSIYSNTRYFYDRGARRACGRGNSDSKKNGSNIVHGMCSCRPWSRSEIKDVEFSRSIPDRHVGPHRSRFQSQRYTARYGDQAHPERDSPEPRRWSI